MAIRSPCTTTRESPSTAMKTQHSQKERKKERKKTTVRPCFLTDNWERSKYLRIRVIRLSMRKETLSKLWRVRIAPYGEQYGNIYHNYNAWLFWPRNSTVYICIFQIYIFIYVYIWYSMKNDRKQEDFFGCSVIKTLRSHYRVWFLVGEIRSCMQKKKKVRRRTGSWTIQFV